MWKDFKEFALRGSVVDLAVGVIIGGAFGQIVSSLVTDIIMPPIGLAIGGIDFSNLYISLSGKTYPSLTAAKQAGAATINYGIFLNNVLHFAIIAFAIFLFAKQVTRFRLLAPPPAAPTAQEKLLTEIRDLLREGKR